ncbi:MAG: hypothetical protein WA701_14445, partial [Solirubrobacterales bacterium]
MSAEGPDLESVARSAAEVATAVGATDAEAWVISEPADRARSSSSRSTSALRSAGTEAGST